MPANPETRESLILRLPTAADAQAWREFIDLYEPLILRFAKRRQSMALTQRSSKTFQKT